jgi:predicted lipoprotein
MTATTATPAPGDRKGTRRLSTGAKRGILVGIIVVVLIALGLGTKVVPDGSSAAQSTESFSAKTWGAKNFPKIQSAIEKKAVDAPTLAQAISTDQAAATKKYGVYGGTGPEFSVKLTGVAGKPEAGIYPITVQGVPGDLVIRVQTGPAINGTDLRDATGTVKFGQFTNQIDYQNAATALNNQMKKKVLGKVDVSALEGKTVTVTGAFQLINPKGWLITPVQLEEK